MVNNDTQYIKKLLEAFYDGTTSLEEEQILKQYFSDENVPEELLIDDKIFVELFSCQYESDLSSLEQKIDILIDRLEDEENNKIHPLPVASKPAIHWRWFVGVAASVFIILSAGIYFHNQSNDRIMIEDTYSNAEDAYVETQKALLLVSGKLNKGFEQMESAQKNIERTNKIIAKNIKL